MTDSLKKFNKIEDNAQLYDRAYYENYNGEAYGRTDHWLAFFGSIADRIVKDINPKSVLDAGCAYGLLVETLRDRNVEAYGIDISEHAVGQAREDIQQFLKVKSLLKPLDKQYDLIVSIEVVEHIPPEDCDKLIENFCTASNQVLLATTPDDYDDPTHFNVNPPLFWIKKFAQFDFYPVITFDASFLTPYAILFKRKEVASLQQVQRLYGAKKMQDLEYSRVVHEKNIKSSELIHRNSQLEQITSRLQDIEKILVESVNHSQNLEDMLDIEVKARKNFQHVVEQYQSSILFKISRPFRIGLKVIKMFFPLFPRKLVKALGKRSICSNATTLKTWGLVQAQLTSDENFAFNLTFDNGKAKERQITIPIKAIGHKRMWLFRKEPEALTYEAKLSTNNTGELIFFSVSTVWAWSRLIMYRWRMGKGFNAAIGLGIRFLKNLATLNISLILEELMPSVSPPNHDYESWLAKYDQYQTDETIEQWINTFQYKPTISILLPTYNSNHGFLLSAIQSVKAQSYSNWQLCIADDASNDESLKELILALGKEDNIDVVLRKTNGHISSATNSALDLAKGEFVAFLDHDDQLHPHALACVVGKINEAPNLDLIYTDEDKIDLLGNRSEPHFKSGWNPDLLLSQNYICHFMLCRRKLLLSLGGLRKGFEGAQDYDLVLRLTEVTKNIAHVPHILYHWRLAENSTASDLGAKSYAHEKSELALKEALVRRNLDAEVVDTDIGAYHRVKYKTPIPRPSVSIIIPTRDQVCLLKKCVNGIIENNSYDSWEILIVDNGSEQQTTFRFFEQIASDNIKVIKYPGVFNYSAINNFGVRHAKGEIILLLNNDTEMIAADWLEELVSHAARPEIGAVGARLYYPNELVQHDGIIMGIGGVAGYANPGLGRFSTSSFGGSKLIRNYSAVTAAALAIKKEIFEEVKGLDEKNLEVAFNDVDFCLRVQAAGYRNIFTPYAELYHHESISRGPDIGSEKAARFEREALYMKEKWNDIIANDPFYNPNLSLRHGFSLDENRSKKWPWQDDKLG